LIVIILDFPEGDILVLKVNRKKAYWFALMIYYALSCVSNVLPAGQVLFMADLLLIAALSIKTRGGNRAYFSGMHVYLLLFTAFCFSTMLWAEHPEYVTSKAVGVLSNCIAIFAISFGYRELKDTNKLLKAIMYGYYLAVIVAIVFYGPNQLISLIKNSDRIAYEGTGAGTIERNTIGMVAAYAIVINIYMLIQNKKIHAYDMLSLPALFLILATGSRKAILIVACGFMGIMLLKNWNKRNMGKSLLKIIGVVLGLIIIFILISRLPIFSGMMERLDDIVTALNGTDYRRGNSAWIRFEYVLLGIKIFMQNPILGIGLGNTNFYTQAMYGHFHYLHNNYVELLAATGIVGTVMYYSIYIHILSVFWKYRKYRNAEYDICLVILLIRLVMDFGAVFYYSKVAYGFLLLFWYKAAHLKDLHKVKLTGNHYR